jgi:hypothetical protein
MPCRVTGHIISEYAIERGRNGLVEIKSQDCVRDHKSRFDLNTLWTMSTIRDIVLDGVVPARIKIASGCVARQVEYSLLRYSSKVYSKRRMEQMIC